MSRFTRKRPPFVLLWIPAVALWLGACPGETELDRDPGARAEEATPVSPKPWFVDRTRDVGLGDFLHLNGMTGERHYSEMMGSGVAFLDIDNDGDLDIYAVQGGPLPDQPDMGSPPMDRLFRNRLIPSGTLGFDDVTFESGIVADGYGMGVTVGDINNDGWVDLYVMNHGSDQLWLNNGDGTFSDHTLAAGIDELGWSVSAAFVDFDQDGHLDLFVVYYVDFSIQRAKPCHSLTGMLDYCGPLTHPAVRDRLYRNRGDGTFEEVSRRLGMVSSPMAGLGVAVLDFDDDGRLDLAVANDGMPNQLWHNTVDPQGSARFEDVAVTTGVSVSSEGQAEAGMGIVSGDPDGDGDEDLLLTHLALETHTLYTNDGSGGFLDRSQPSGLGAPSWDLTGFGVAFFDVDLDGDQDVAAVAGGVKVIPEQLDAGEAHPLKMRKQLFMSSGERFSEVDSTAAGEPFTSLSVGRGLAAGDVDNDGDPDLLVSNNAGPLELLINRRVDHGEKRSAHWVGLRLLHSSGREALGAVVLEPTRIRVGTDGSYGSARDPRLILAAETPEALPRDVRIRWTNGTEERFVGLEPGTYNILHQGRGQSP